MTQQGPRQQCWGFLCLLLNLVDDFSATPHNYDMEYQSKVQDLIKVSKPDGLVTKLKHMCELWADIMHHTQMLTVKNQSERVYLYSQGLTSTPLCACGGTKKFISITEGYRDFCSSRCVHAKQAATERRVLVMKQNGGVGLANPKSKAKAAATLQSKHGTDVINPGQIKTNRVRMTVQNPMDDPASLKKISHTLSTKYGSHVQNASHIHLNEFQCELLTNPTAFETFVAGKTCTQVANETGINYSTILNLAKKFNVLPVMVYNHRSEMEHDLKQWLISQSIPFKHDDRSTLQGHKEIDFMLSDFNFGIELNGLPTHSEIAGKKHKNYHFNKFKECADKGITLLQFWPDEYWGKKHIIHSKILYLCGHIKNKVPARLCTIAELKDVDLERSFLTLNHIQGFPSYRQHSLGAWYQDNLVGVMSFAYHKGRMELVRFATDINAVAPGLFSRLFSQSIKQFGISGEVISMSDNRVSNGNVYLQSGWSHVRDLPPTYCYTKDQFKREDKQHFRKQKLATRFNLSQTYVDEHTEWQIMQDLGYDRLWDAGKKIWSRTV